MLTIKDIKKAVAKIGKKYGVKSVYLFGSYAKGTATEDSDVDLIIDHSNIRTYKDYFHMCKDLRDALGKEVDVTSEDEKYADFFALVNKDRVLLYGA